MYKLCIQVKDCVSHCVCERERGEKLRGEGMNFSSGRSETTELISVGLGNTQELCLRLIDQQSP